MKKIDKASAGYIHFENTNYTCSQCYKFEPNNGHRDCAEVGGAIAPDGGCNTFVAGPANQAIPVRMPRKLIQIEAGYLINKVGFSCKRCEYFLHDNWDCRRVDKDSEGPDRGMIHPEACCNNWAKSPLFGMIA